MKIASKSYVKWKLLRARPVQQHLIFVFWIPLYVFWISYEVMAQSSFGDISIILLSAIGAFHALAYLIAYHWSLFVNSFNAFKRSQCIEDATHIYLESFLSPVAIVPILQHSDSAGRKYFSFTHLEARFLCFDGQTFIKAKWLSSLHHDDRDCQHPKSLTCGNESENVIRFLKQVFGKNSLTIPIPSFMSLMKEHVIAPFFVFQLVCVGLWILDTYWYHSLMILAMLFIFEATVVFQRLKNMNEIRGMAPPPQSCLVLRCNQWVSGVSSEDLLPGDIIGLPSEFGDVLSVPADMLILYGSCIVNEALLSGESTPCMKESMEISAAVMDEIKRKKSISFKSAFKTSAIFGGTKILQITSNSATENDLNLAYGEVPQGIALIALVVRTGFLTTQGKLVRTMCLGRERISANNAEAGYFILFLLFFAIVAAIYVWNAALTEDPDRSRWRLLVQCLLIITSVVPPELPMELSMAINASLLALSKLSIFCTEPFRLPIAGSIDVCCFDKTGTLTQSHLEFIGITGIDSGKKKSTPCALIKDPGEIPGTAQLVIASCHSLVLLNNTAAGDPLEVAALDSIPWSLSSTKGSSKIVEKVANLPALLAIMKRFAFSPSLKRMSVMVEIEQTSKTISSALPEVQNRTRFVTCKGAPESIYPLLVDPPTWFFDVAEQYASEGCRIIALAFKCLGIKGKDLDRVSAESGLTFAGFLIFGASMKKEACEVIAKLSASHHKNVMITGDHALTAIHVAKKLQFGQEDADDSSSCTSEKPTYLLLDCDVEESGDEKQRSIAVSNLHSKSNSVFSDDEQLISFLSSPGLSKFRIAITGPAFEVLSLRCPQWLQSWLVKRITVCARFSPSNKEDILRLFKALGWSTLMCGDGTNDVGALKQAHIGVALLDGTAEDLEKIAQNQRKMAIKRRYEDLRRMGISEAQIAKLQANDRNFANLVNDDEEEVPMLQFGDASVAAPFTSKIGTLESVCHVLKQGRATLAATFQMYKILALNSLITAYSLSVLHNAGVRLGDFQLTISGLLLSSCFFFLSRSKPLSTLSKERPASTIFTVYSITSIIGQFAVHCFALIYLDQCIRIYSPEKPLLHSEDYTFTPSLMNSSIYLLSLLMQVSTFAINYQGPPFRESMLDNGGLKKSLFAVGSFVLVSAAEIFPDMNEMMQIVPFPPGFSAKLLFLMISDFFICFVIEVTSKRLFSKVEPKWKTTSK